MCSVEFILLLEMNIKTAFFLKSHLNLKYKLFAIHTNFPCGRAITVVFQSLRKYCLSIFESMLLTRSQLLAIILRDQNACNVIRSI